MLNKIHGKFIEGERLQFGGRGRKADPSPASDDVARASDVRRARAKGSGAEGFLHSELTKNADSWVKMTSRRLGRLSGTKADLVDVFEARAAQTNQAREVRGIVGPPGGVVDVDGLL